MERRFVPRVDDDTATATFINFEGRTFAVTAHHVIEAFGKHAEADNPKIPEPYICPAATGVIIKPPFVQPPKPMIGHQPDVALTEIPSDLPSRIGKEAFSFNEEPKPTFPIPYAMAVGFPTREKKEREAPGGVQLAMTCFHAVAEGVPSREEADQVQFFSELEKPPSTHSLSGLSGGPVFWSDGDRFGLVGFVKQALDITPAEGAETIHSGPRVHYLVQRASYAAFGEWVTYALNEIPKRREAFDRELAAAEAARAAEPLPVNIAR